MRAGAQALSLLAVPLNIHVLEALADAPTPLADLRREVGLPPQTTMRTRLRHLVEIGALHRRRHSEFPGTVDCELTPGGKDLVALTRVTANWLRTKPDDPLALDSVAAGSAIRALVEGWSSTTIRALAARPLSLTELNRLISAHNYPSLERRLGAMRLAGQVEAQSAAGRGTPYGVTSWLRRSVAPLALAARWERKHIPEAATRISRIDIEAFFLLAVPLLRLPVDLNGTLRLVAELRNPGDEPDLAGVMVDVREGEIVSCVSRLRGDADSWAVGSTSTWLRALLGDEIDRLETGGDAALSAALLDRLPGALLGAGQGV